MSQCANEASQFALDYENYWKGVSNRRIAKRKLEAAEKVTSPIANMVESVVEDIGCQVRKRHHSIVDSASSSSLLYQSK